MSTGLSVPKEIEAVIERFDNATSPFSIREIQSSLAEARASLQSPTEIEKLGAWAEVLAFALVGSRSEESPWGTYFGPIATLRREDGTLFYRPDIEEAEPAVWLHWCNRAQGISQPVLRSRYADLAWDMALAIGKQPRRSASWAVLAVDAYLTSLSAKAVIDDYEKFNVVIRALDLAIQIRDTARIDQARKTLIDFHHATLAKERGQWWVAFDRLFGDRRTGVSSQELAALAADLEALLTKFSDTTSPSSFNPHDAEGVAKRLLKFYSRQRDSVAVKRIHATVGRSFEHFASLGDAMLASIVLQTSVNAYRQAGLPDDAARTRILMQEKIGQARGEMKRFETSIEIPKEDVEKFLAEIVPDELGSSFARIASSFVPKRVDVEAQVKQTLTDAPLMARIGQDVVSNDRVVAKIGSVEDDLHGRVVHHAFTLSGLETFWLEQALDRVREKHSLMPEHVVAWANRLGLFSDTSFVLEGVYAWFDGDFVKAVHVLVPQVEHALRKIVELLGKPTTKSHPGIPGASVAIGMGDILHGQTDVTQALGHDLVLYFLVHYADPRGKNLRNDLAHGLLKYSSFTSAHALWLIHTLLVLGVWDQLAKR